MVESIKNSQKNINALSNCDKPRGFYEFGPYRLDVTGRTVSRNSESVRDVTPKLFDLLLFLIRNRHRVLEREEIIRTLWSDGYGDDRNLSGSIFNLRKALGDTGHEHYYIATIPLHGYQFVAQVTEVPEHSEPILSQTQPSAPAQRTRRSIRTLPAFVVGGLFLLVLASAFFWLNPPHRRNSDRILILVADFDRRALSNQYRLTRTICDRLREVTSRYSQAEVRLLGKSISWQEGSEVARREGAKRGADVVIWGDLDPGPERAIVTAYFEVLEKSFEVIFRDGTNVSQVPIAAMKDLTYQDELSRKITCLTVFLLGVARYEARDYPGAIERFSDVLDRPDAQTEMLDPSAVRFYRALASHELALNRLSIENAFSDLDSALSDFSQVIEKRPHHSSSFWNRGLSYARRGELYEKHGKTEQAEADLRAAIADFEESIAPKLVDHDFLKKKPDPVDVRWNRGLTHTHLAKLAGSGDPARSLEHLNEATVDFTSVLEGASGSFLTRKSHDVHFNRGLAEADLSEFYLKAGRLDEAARENGKGISDFTEVLRLRPTHPGAFYNRGLAYARKGEKAMAIADLTTFIKLPGNSSIKEKARQKLQALLSERREMPLSPDL